MTGQSASLENNAALAALPYRGTFGEERPPALLALALPPARMPARAGLRPLKSWRYIGLYGPQIMLCLAGVRIGPARQEFWAIWDRVAGRLYERTRLRPGYVSLRPGGATVVDDDVRIELELDEEAGVETVTRSGQSYAWTRKQGGIRARALVVIAGETFDIAGRAIVDDTAGYYARHTTWQWCAGVGAARDGRGLAWNLVSGVHDSPERSERTVWIDGEPHEAPPSTFAEDLSSVDALRFSAEAERRRSENLVLIRSTYRQPFGTFRGVLPGGVELANGFGVMESHDVRW